MEFDLNFEHHMGISQARGRFCVQTVMSLCRQLTNRLVWSLTLLHSEQPKLHSFGCSESNRVKLHKSHISFPLSEPHDIFILH